MRYILLSKLPQKPYNAIPRQRTEREFAHRVMAARQPGDFAWNATTAKLVEGLLREFRNERLVVLAGQHQEFSVCSAKPLNKRIRADGRPQESQPLQIDLGFERVPDVCCRKSRPHDVGEEAGNMDEDAGGKAFIVRECEKTNTGSDTGSENSDA